MTRFLLSHNLQVQSACLPALSAQDLAVGLATHTPANIKLEVLSHPHWLVQLDAELAPDDLADAVLLAWRQFRCSAGATDNACKLLALGGRKDEPAGPGSALQQGDWGVDVIETLDIDAFLESINWELLRQGRSTDGVFQVQG
jgi:hypothetical protein